jgi:type IX secretion system PorP/SprF family membrane protein
MRKILFSCILILGSVNVFSQQDALYSQYMFNPFAINPAYAGSRDATSAVILFRQQWVGIEGAPVTQTFSIHSPFAKQKMALGLNVFNDQIGPMRNAGVMGTYAYILQAGKMKLSFGLRGGVFNSRLDRSILSYQDPSDRFNNTGTVNALVPTFDFGTYLYSKRFFAGLSVTHLLENEFNYENFPSDAYVVMKRHFMFSTGMALPIGESTVFKPSVLVKYVDAAPVNIDVNASFLFKKVFWLGASFRTSNGVVVIAEYNVTDFMRIGYSYDIVLNRLKRFTSGTHELMVGFDFNLKKTRSVSPRYL